MRKSTALPARRFKLERRGLLAPGYWADVTVFDAERIGTGASYLEPRHAPRGIHHLLVNGEWALREGRLLDRFPGRPLKHRG